MSEPLVISQDAVVIDHVQSSAAAANITLCVTQQVNEIRRQWSAASVVIIGVDCAAMVAGLGLTDRPGLHLVGTTAEAVLAWSVPLNAPGLVLPNQAGLLSALLDDSHHIGAATGRLLRFAGATGGLGVSTMVSGLAVRAARRGHRVALVELDSGGGGLDVMMGAEGEPGWRWNDLLGARGHVGDLSDHLPKTCGVSIVAASRPLPTIEFVDQPAIVNSGQVTDDRSRDIAAEAVATVLASLRRSFDLVFLDQGRLRSALEEVIWLVGAEVRAVLAARSILDSGTVLTRRIILRTGPGRRLPADLVAESLGLSVIGQYQHDPRLPAALAVGDPPGRAQGGISRGLDIILDSLLEPARPATWGRHSLGSAQTPLGWLRR